MLSPENIYNNIISSNTDIDKGILILRSLIENSNSAKIRGKSIEVLCRLMVNEDKLFKILENCLISDESPTVRSVAAKEILINFPKKCIIPLRWTIQNDKSNFVIKKILNLIEKNTNSELFVLKKDLDKRFMDRYGVLEGEAKFCLDFEILYPKHVLKNRIKISKDNHIFELDLGWDISRIPKSLSNLKWLKKLSLDSNYELVNVPKLINTLVTELNFCQKYIDDGVNPNDALLMWFLEALTGIELRNSKSGIKGVFTYETDEKGNIVRLTIGGIEDAYLRTFPQQIFSLKKLRELDLCANAISSLPEINKKNNSLKYLNLSYNVIKGLPKSIDNLSELETLILQGNKLQEIPGSLGILESLYLLDLSDNELRKVPDSIGNLVKLKKLFLSGNSIKTIPESIGNLESLELLDLSENAIEKIPDSIGNLENLKTFRIFQNRIERIPITMEKLESLESFEIGGNKIKKIPEIIHRLKKKSLKHFVLKP